MLWIPLSYWSRFSGKDEIGLGSEDLMCKLYYMNQGLEEWDDWSSSEGRCKCRDNLYSFRI